MALVIDCRWSSSRVAAKLSTNQHDKLSNDMAMSRHFLVLPLSTRFLDIVCEMLVDNERQLTVDAMLPASMQCWMHYHWIVNNVKIFKLGFHRFRIALLAAIIVKSSISSLNCALLLPSSIYGKCELRACHWLDFEVHRERSEWRQIASTSVKLTLTCRHFAFLASSSSSSLLHITASRVCADWKRYDGCVDRPIWDIRLAILIEYTSMDAEW